MQDQVNRAFPDAAVCLFLVGDKLVVTGEAKDAVEATRILQVIRATAPAAGGRTNTIPVQLNVQTSAVDLAAGGGSQALQNLNNYILQGEPNIVNLLKIPGEQQVISKSRWPR